MAAQQDRHVTILSPPPLPLALEDFLKKALDIFDRALQQSTWPRGLDSMADSAGLARVVIVHRVAVNECVAHCVLVEARLRVVRAANEAIP